MLPFDLYDFFGYLFPGILFATNMMLVIYEIDKKYFNKIYDISLKADGNFLLTLSFIIASIIIFYTLGHIIAALSHLIIDRMLIDGIEGYPMSYVLDLEKEDRYFLEGTFKLLFFFFNTLLLTPVILNKPYQTITIYIILGIIFILIITRTIIMMLRQNNKEKINDLLNKINSKKLLNRIWNYSINIFWEAPLFIIDLIIGFLRRLTGIDRKFKKPMIKLFKENFNDRYGMDVEKIGSDSYWLPVLYGMGNNQTYYKLLNNWLYLYGYARNTCAAFYLTLFLVIIYSLININVNLYGMKLHLLIMWIIAAILGIRYWVLYSHYYTKAVVRIFVESLAQSNKLKK